MRSHVEARLRESVKALEGGAPSWIAPRFFGATLVGMICSGLVAGADAFVFDPSSLVFWLRWVSPAALALPLTVGAYRAELRKAHKDPAEVVSELESQWRKLTGRGWVRRTLRTWGCLAVGVGAPVGALMALGFPASELPGGSRLLAFGGFLAATAVWTLPAAFGLRALAMHNVRRFMRPAAEPARAAAKRVG